MESETGATAIAMLEERPEAEELSWEALERQDWHLWIPAILLVLVLGVSLLSFTSRSRFGCKRSWWCGRRSGRSWASACCWPRPWK